MEEVSANVNEGMAGLEESYAASSNYVASNMNDGSLAQGDPAEANGDADEEAMGREDDWYREEDLVMILDGVGSFDSIDFATLSVEDMRSLEFVDLKTAYDFYNEYGRIKGFSIRRSKVGRSSKVGQEGDILWQMFVCSRQGERDMKHVERGDRKMDPRPVTRCGCTARMKVHVDRLTNRWFIEYMFDEHNHELVHARFRGLMRSHRSIKEGDLHQINVMRKAGMRVPTIFRAFASQSGGFETVGFEMKDIYNAIEKQRRVGASDAESAIKFLAAKKGNDPNMFWKYALDSERRLQNIFWCDGTSRFDYSVFGDVLGFDATYGRNRYKCPLVIFSGVDHHMRTMIFGCAILSNESEDSYVWLLRAFLEAMNGKEPRSVMTDGDISMKNAISAVFPSAHHRLCSWHLLRNATARVGKPRFLSRFRVCMMGDLEVDEFEELWSDTVAEFCLDHNNWVRDLYERKHMWSNAHIRGKFFAGLKTTSRCEALNMQIGKFIGNGYNLREFIEHFQHYLEFLRRKELVADYKSVYGDPVATTRLDELERFAATVYTKEVFELFREVLLLASNVRVGDCKRTSACTFFEVTMYCRDKTWSVAWDEADDEFCCSCLRMESFGIPCVHIIGVLIHLNITNLPTCLILNRWTKKAKQPLDPVAGRFGEVPDAAYMSMHASMLDDCRELVKMACRYFEDYNEVKLRIAKQRQILRDKHRSRMGTSVSGERLHVRDPLKARHKGCGRKGLTSRGKYRRVQRCRMCGGVGHNARKCAAAVNVPSCSSQPTWQADEDGIEMEFEVDGEEEDGMNYSG